MRRTAPFAPSSENREREREEARRRARAEYESFRNSSAWLQDAVRFTDARRLPESSRGQVAGLLQLIAGETHARYKKLHQKHLDLEILLANLSYSHDKDKPLAVSLRVNDYSPRSRYRRVSPFLIDLVHLLVSRQMVNHTRGFYDHDNPKRSRSARIWANEELEQCLSPLTGNFENLDFHPVELVHLNDDRKKVVPYKDTPLTNRVRGLLRRANMVNRAARVEYRTPTGWRRLGTDLYAVYNEGWDRGGRLYTGEGGYQALGKTERGTIHIDGIPTIELDFSGMLPRLVYTWEGIPYPDDPYTAVRGKEALRNFFKILFLAMLNSSSRAEAVAAGNFKLHEDHRLYRMVELEADTCVVDLVDEFEQVHAPIARHFYSGAWARAFNEDSKIALAVVDHFTAQEIPILAIHDSFIVQVPHLGELRTTMEKAYRKQTGGFDCPVK